MKRWAAALRRPASALGALAGLEKLFFAFAALQTLLVWLHRSFPTQDGPMQIYLAGILEDLLRGTGLYSSYYRIQGLIHPYSFTSYSLTLLNQAFTPLTAEKILVSLYFIAFPLGVRYLVRSIQPENRWLPLFLLPFAFNTFLCLGIYNFSCGLVLLMFLIGMWLRWSGQWNATRSALWLALIMLLAAMHHVPVLILGVFSGAHLAATALLTFRASRPSLAAPLPAVWRRLRGDFANAALLLAPVAWYAVFAIPAAGEVSATVSSAPIGWADRLRELAAMVPLSPYLGFGYCVCLLLLVVVPAALLLLNPEGSSFAGKSAPGACAALSVTALVCLAVYALGPSFLFGHGHGYFAERMAVPFIICCLAVTAPLRLPPHVEKVATVFVACLFCWMLAVREFETTRMVAELAPIYDAKPVSRGLSGAVVSGAEPIDGSTFNPYYWAGAIYAAQNKSVLLNLSGSYEAISLFGNKSRHPWDDVGSPAELRRILADSPAAAAWEVTFLCGGKWGAASQEIEHAATLAQRRGLTRVLDSNLFYCYGRDAASPLQAQRKE